MSLTIVSDALDAEDFALLLLALNVLDQQTSDELAIITANNAEAAPLGHRRSRLLLVRAKLRAMQGSDHMNAVSQVATAPGTDESKSGSAVLNASRRPRSISAAIIRLSRRVRAARRCAAERLPDRLGTFERWFTEAWTKVGAP